jgi:3-oxoacyl-[acyl-carrier-protein] synthase-1
MAEVGFRCAVFAPVLNWTPEGISRRALQTMSPGAQYATGAALEALAQAGLPPNALHSQRAGAIVGMAFGGHQDAIRVEQVLVDHKSPSRAGGTGIVKMMNSTASGNLASFLGVRGRAYSISSAFSSGVDSIGHAFELIAHDLQDVCLAGAAEEAAWRTAGVSLEAAGALADGFNDRPTAACRPYDRDRRGLVLSEGAGILVLEALEYALSRGAQPLAEVVAYAAANDGADVFRPTGQALRSVLTAALAQAAHAGVERVTYVNTHATGTPLGDAVEAGVLRDVFGDGPNAPWVSSTKGQAGHALGATGAQETVYTLLMLQHGFLAPTANLEHLDPACSGVRHLTRVQHQPVASALKLSTGFGGSNACIILRTWPGNP